MSVAGRILVLNGFAFNFGFYMFLPFLADHLQQDINLAGWLIGVVLGLRVFSQQGMFLVGGAIGDRWGYRNTILLGCVIRILGFALLGVSSELTSLLIGAFLTGFAGALFTPSSQAYLASESDHQSERNKVFALQNLTSEAGMLLGPLVGLTLVNISFDWVGWSAAIVFVILLIIQWRYLPEKTLEKSASQPVLKQWGGMLVNKPFMKFVLWASAYQVLFHQLYLAIPTTARALTEGAQLITLVFTTSSLLGVFLQLPIAQFVEKRMQMAMGIGLGLGLMGIAYLPLMFASEQLIYLAFLSCAALLSLGSMFVFPLLGASVPQYANQSELASYYGLYACIGGLAAFLSNVIIGNFLPSTGIPNNKLWIGLCLVGVVSGAVLYFQLKQTKLAKAEQGF